MQRRIKRSRIRLTGACSQITINDMVYLHSLVDLEVYDFIISDLEIELAIQNAFKQNLLYKINDNDQYFLGETPAGIPILH